MEGGGDGKGGKGGGGGGGGGGLKIVIRRWGGDRAMGQSVKNLGLLSKNGEVRRTADSRDQMTA